MRNLLAAGTLLAALVLPAQAQATEWMYCIDNGEEATMSLLLGATNVISIDTIEMEANGKKWSTKPGDGVITITKGQAFETDDQMWVDVTDDAVNEIVAELRLFKAVEGEDYVASGTMRIAGEGVWSMACSGP